LNLKLINKVTNITRYHRFLIEKEIYLYSNLLYFEKMVLLKSINNIFQMNTNSYSSFKPIAIEDKDVFKKYFSDYPSQFCDLNFVNLMVWNSLSNVYWYEHENRLYIYFSCIDSLVIGIGKETLPNELTNVSNELRRIGKSGIITLIKNDYIQDYRSTLETDFLIEEDDNFRDYIYYTKDLATLCGKKLSKKKNQINQFKKLYPNYVVRPITLNDMESCIELTKTWIDSKNEIDEYMEYEMKAIIETWNLYNSLEIEGLVILVYDVPVAYSIFSCQSKDTADIHFEKFDHSFKGSGQLINQETAIFLKNKYVYINREQDLNIEGLKKAKRSYCPAFNLKAFRLVPKHHD